MDKLNKSLPQIIRDTAEMEALLWESGGEVTPEIEEVYNQYLLNKEEELPKKIDNVIEFMARVQHTGVLLKQQADDLNRKVKTLNNVIDAMQFNVLQAVRNNKGKLETGRWKLSIRKSQSVEIIAPDILPDKFVQRKITEAPIKNEIKKALKNGQIVPGAVLKEKENLNIR